MNIWMLDHDPVKAARAHSDHHLRLGLAAYTQALAYAWHTLHNAAYQELRDDRAPDVTPWFAQHFHPVDAPRPRPSPFPGESPLQWWLLFGQRVPRYPFELPNSAQEWAAYTGGNYRWLWSVTMELGAEYQYRWPGGRHPATPACWTLEAVPYSLRETLEQWTETPLDTMPLHLRVAVGTYYDTVASNRRYYNTKLKPEAWTRRRPPSWHTEEAEQTETAL